MSTFYGYATAAVVASFGVCGIYSYARNRRAEAAIYAATVLLIVAAVTQ